MSAPSKLAVEIAEAIAAEMTSGKPKSRNREEGIARLASVIDAKIRPLVEDGARLDWLDTHCVLSQKPQHDWMLHFLKMGQETNNPLRAMVDAARAQRPAQEGSET